MDCWIGSGFEPDGSEHPRQRHLTQSSAPLKAMLRYSISITPWMLIGDRGGVELYPRMSQYRNQPGAPAKGIGSRHAIEWTEEELEVAAAGLFLCFFYNSKWVFLVMKCRRCGLYEVNNPRKSYVRGWHCAKCRKTAPAAMATDKIRADRRDKWFGLAVKAWAQSEKVNGDRIAWVTRKVNDGLRKMKRMPDPIKRNTITRNLKAIEAASLAQGHAVSSQRGKAA